MKFITPSSLLVRILLLTVSVTGAANADTIYFDNSASPVASGSFISAAVSQVIRFKTDTFATTDNLSFVDVSVNQFNVLDGILPTLTIYTDADGELGSALASAQFGESLTNTRPLQAARADFSGAPALASDSYYWIGMGFASGATGSLGWSTSLQNDMTSLAFITAGGVNYVGTFNMPNVKIVGTTAATIPESGAVAFYLAVAVGCLALYRRQQFKVGAALT